MGSLGFALWLAGVQLGTPDGTGYAQPMDLAVARWFAMHRPEVFVWIAEGIGFVFDTLGILVVTALVVVWLLWKVGRRPIVLAPFVAVVLAGTVAEVVKLGVARPRPDAALRAVTDGGFSFPSVHAATTAALAVSVIVIAWRVIERGHPPVRLTIWLSIAAAVVALSRLVIGVHWSTDVVAGLVTGTAVALVVVNVALMDAVPRPRVRNIGVVPRLVLIALAAGSVAIGASYVSALRAPGYATLDVRTVDWLKGHGLTSAVDRTEAWWLWRHPPSTKDTLTALPAAPASTSPVPTGHLPAGVTAIAEATVPSAPTPSGPSPVPPILAPPLPGEGQWTPVQAANGRVEIASTTIRPDPVHPDVTVTLAWMDPAAVKFSLIAGTRQPGNGPGPSGAQVPVALQPQLVAAFNSGYKLRDTPGGALEEGLLTRTLQDGLASFVVHSDGSATIAMWGRDAQLTPDVVGVRQNLHLIIDGGQVLPGLRQNIGGLWGGVRSTLPTWRSAVGVDATGHILYAGGNLLTLDVLANALHAAGAVRAMELDIHRRMVEFNLYDHPPGAVRPVGRKLSPDMTSTANRYLVPDQRDFIAVFAR